MANPLLGKVPEESSLSADGVEWDVEGTEGDPNDEDADYPPWHWDSRNGTWIDTTRF